MRHVQGQPLGLRRPPRKALGRRERCSRSVPLRWGWRAVSCMQSLRQGASPRDAGGLSVADCFAGLEKLKARSGSNVRNCGGLSRSSYQEDHPFILNKFGNSPGTGLLKQLGDSALVQSPSMKPYCDICVRTGQILNLSTMIGVARPYIQGKVFICQIHTHREYHPHVG
jgi:hypothetical protein